MNDDKPPVDDPDRPKYTDPADDSEALAVSDFASFKSSLETEINSLGTLAYEKYVQEETVIRAGAGIGAGIPLTIKRIKDGGLFGPGIDEAMKAIMSFVEIRCQQDVTALQAMRGDLKKTLGILHAGSTEKKEDEIKNGLDAWTSNAGRTFRSKYLSQLANRRADLLQDIAKSENFLKTAQRIVVNARRIVLHKVKEGQKALEDYNPIVEGIVGGIHFTMVGIGFVPGAGVFTAPLDEALSAVDKLGDLTTDLTVAGLMTAIQESFDALRQVKEAEEKNFADDIDAKHQEVTTGGVKGGDGRRGVLLIPAQDKH